MTDPLASTPPSDDTAQRERARQLAEDWHEGVPKDRQHEWACQAAGLLLHFAEKPLIFGKEPSRV